MEKIKKILICSIIFMAMFSINNVYASRPTKYSDLTDKHKAILKEVADDRGYIAYQDVGSLNTELTTKFNEMKTEAAKSGRTLNIVSGYRSYNDQIGAFFNSGSVTNSIPNDKIFKEDESNRVEAKQAYLARSVASAPPGYSEHSTGLAIDINSVQASFENTPEYTWLTANASTYGFELSYPKNSTAGAGFEPWHWRYVGGTKKLSDYLGLSDGASTPTAPTTPTTPGGGTGSSTGPGKITYKSFTAFPGIGQISSLCELTKALWFIGFGILFISVLGMYMYGGFLYTSAGVNASGVNRAKEIFTNSTIGLVLGLSIYVILNTLNPNLLNAQCTIGSVMDAPTGSGSNVFTPTGQIGSDIYKAALSLEGASSVGCGAACGNGNLACQYMVNKVLEKAGLDPLDGLSTGNAEDELKGGRGTALTQSDTQPGDIVYAVTDHVGICLNVGCSEILSNSSSKAKFSWRSGANFDGGYGSTPITYYRVNN